MCSIAPGGIPDSDIGPRGDVAAAELTTIDEAIVATTTTATATTAPKNPGAPELGIRAMAELSASLSRSLSTVQVRGSAPSTKGQALLDLACGVYRAPARDAA
jgi:hypothetical protein